MIKCRNCKENFKPNNEQQNFIDISSKKRMAFIMLECKSCGLYFDLNLNKLKKQSLESLLLRTPFSGSLGFVSFIDDGSKSFYGCGETGIIWKEKTDLYKDIEQIILKYPHRKKVYLNKCGEWIANPDEPKNIDELICNESN